MELTLGPTHLQFAAADGLIAIGLFDDAPTFRNWWSRPKKGDVGSILARQDLSSLVFLGASDLGWAVGASYWIIVLAMSIVPAWWWIDRSEQSDLDRRRALGHCRRCGYDLRMSPDTCPECGRRARRIQRLMDAPAPAPRAAV
jgi:hypothetical protein